MAQAKRKAEPAPPEQIRALAQLLNKGELPAAILLRGEERYFADQALGLIQKAADAKG